MDWLDKKVFNLSYIAERLYGARTPTTTSRLAHKLSGRTPWNDEEKAQLEVIREDIIKMLGRK